MITTIVGDLLDFPQGIDIIAHSCNCRNTMGAGIALQIKQRYPDVYRVDTNAYENGVNTLGNISICSDIQTGKHIINMYTQASYGSNGRFVSYDALNSALQKVKDFALSKTTDNTTLDTNSILVGLPYNLSCGLAGGDWDTVKSIVNSVFYNDGCITHLVNVVFVKNLKYVK